MRRQVPGGIPASVLALSTNETVVRDTPASAATSALVARGFRWVKAPPAWTPAVAGMARGRRARSAVLTRVTNAHYQTPEAAVKTESAGTRGCRAVTPGTPRSVRAAG